MFQCSGFRMINIKYAFSNELLNLENITHVVKVIILYIFNNRTNCLDAARVEKDLIINCVFRLFPEMERNGRKRVKAFRIPSLQIPRLHIISHSPTRHSKYFPISQHH